jgi:subtilisin-like proprotein convertase family protein
VLVSPDGVTYPIPDSVYNGNISTMVCVELTVPADACANVVTGVTVTMDAVHSWVGDLTIKLVHPDMTPITLMSRPGVVETADNGEGTSPESANLVAGYPITFATGAPTSAEDMGNTLNNSTQGVCVDDQLCSFAPNPGTAGGPALTSLNGKSAVGTWKFCVGDSETDDTGTINRVTLTISR